MQCAVISFIALCDVLSNDYDVFSWFMPVESGSGRLSPMFLDLD